MGKYIINIENEDMITNGHIVIPLEVCVQGNEEKIKFNCEVTNDLTLYTEPDLEQVKKEAYENGYENGFVAGHLKAEKSGQSFYEDGYQRGLNDAWDAARKIINMPEADLLNLFTECYAAVCTSVQVFLKYDASECTEKIRQYEQEKEMDGLRQNIQTIIDKCGYTLDEIAEVLQKMKETNNG